MGVDGWYVKVQVNSGVHPMLHLKAQSWMCITLRPCTAGDVLKWKTMAKFSKVKLSAGVLLTVKSVGWTLLGSVGSLRKTVKSSGGVLITLPQSGSVMYTKQTDGVGVGLGGTVAVGVNVAVGVGVGDNVGVGVGDGVVPLCTSNDPTSMRLLRRRQKTGPRWSKKGGGVNFGSPASIAGLPGNSAWVEVGPPLFCKGPSIGLVLI